MPNIQQISAAAINSNFAEILEELETKADLNGSSSEVFNVANATTSTQAVNKGQLDSAVCTINTSIAAKADKTYVDANLALKVNTSDLEDLLATKADLNGNSSELFNVADATEATNAINKRVLDLSLADISSDISDLETELRACGSNIRFCMNSGNVDSSGNSDLFSYNPLPIIITDWENPKMTSMTAPSGTVTNAPTSRLHQGNSWAMFSSNDYTIYYRGYSGVEAPYTQYALASGTVHLTRILPMTETGDYIKGTGCSCTTYLNGVPTSLGTITFSQGLTLTSPIEFDTIRFHSFTGGGHPDLVGWSAFHLEGYTSVQNPNSSGTDYSTLYTKTGGSYPNAVGTNVNGEKITLAETKTLSFSSYENGAYNVFLKSDGTLEAFSNTIFTQKHIPTGTTLSDNTIPDMTSNTAPRGTVTSTGTNYSGYYDYLSFNSTNGCGMSPTTSTASVTYTYASNEQPAAGTYNLGFNVNSWASGRYYTCISGMITYTDNTTLQVFNNTSGTTANTMVDYCYSFTATKTIASITISMNCAINIASATLSKISLKRLESRTDDIWLDTSVEPLKAKKYDGSSWVDYTGLPMGTVTVLNEAITAVSTRHYNENGYDRPYTYDSGWFAVSYDQTYTKTHGLGSAKLNINVYFASDVNGTNNHPNNSYYVYNNVSFGSLISSVTPNTLSVIAGHYVDGASYLTSGYYRIMAETMI